MIPCILPGDRLFIVGHEGKFNVGDIIVRIDGTNPVVHRIIAVDLQGRDQAIATKGDNSRLLDRVCRPQDVLGRVNSVERDGKVIRLSDPVLCWFGRSLAHLSRISFGLRGGDAYWLRRDDVVSDLPSASKSIFLKGMFVGIRWFHGMLVRIKMTKIDQESGE